MRAGARILSLLRTRRRRDTLAQLALAPLRWMILLIAVLTLFRVMFEFNAAGLTTERSLATRELFDVAATLLASTLVFAWARRRLTARLIHPTNEVVIALRRLAMGDRNVVIPGLDRSDELGRIARAMVVFQKSRKLAEQLQVFARTTSDAMVVIDPKRKIAFWNEAAERLFGWTAAEAIGQFVSMALPPRNLDQHAANHVNLLAGTSKELLGQAEEIMAVHKDGHEICVEVTRGTWKEEDGVHIGVIVRDLTRWKREEEQRRRTTELLDAIVENMPASLCVKDAHDHSYLLVNRAFEDLTQRPRAEFIGHTPLDFYPEDEALAYIEQDKHALHLPEVIVDEEAHTRADGVTRLLRTRKVGIDRDESGAPRLILSVSEDVTERREAQDHIRHLALHDPLTGLPNRRTLNDELANAFGSGRAGAVMLLDLDRFKAINDVNGHPFGDEILRQVASRLCACAQGHLVARMGGDEFALVVLDAPAAAIEAIAQSIVTELGKPFIADRKHVHIGASVGVTEFPSQASDAEQALRHADLALYRAKTNGRGNYCSFTPHLDQRQRERRQLTGELHDALDRGDIIAHYQPLAAMDGRILGFEALARWRHPELGPIPPETFIAVAEESGLILDLGMRVLRQAVRDAVKWPAELSIAVNLSPLQMQQPGLADDIGRLLVEERLDPSRLELEITEGTLTRDTDQAVRTLTALKAIGVRIGMDDFGTGYSSLSYFRLFPFDKIKIDQSFVRDMEHSPQALAIVQAVIGLGHGLNLPVIAEGVETQAQLDRLRAEGVDGVQGYLIGRPGPIKAYVNTLTSHTRPLAA
jgi:diguanylate cyclase (GGDEF)-like protein/PAS domain S-box-containing protein